MKLTIEYPAGEDVLLTRQQCSERLGISLSLFDELVSAGIIPSIVITDRVKRFQWAAVLAAFQKSKP